MIEEDAAALMQGVGYWDDIRLQNKYRQMERAGGGGYNLPGAMCRYLFGDAG